MAHVAEYAQITDLAFSPDGMLLASASDDASIRLWDVATQREVLRLTQQRPADDDSQDAWEQWDGFLPLSIQFSPDGALLASGQIGGGAIKLWNVYSGREYGVLAGHPVMRKALPYPHLVPAEERDHIPRPGHIVALAFTQDGQTLLSASHDNTIGVWDLATFQGKRIASPHTYQIDALALHPSHQYVMSGGSILTGIGERIQPAAVIHRWCLPDVQYSSSLTLSLPYVEDARFTPDGTFLFGIDARGHIFWWDTTTWVRRGNVKSTAPFVTGLLVSPDGKYLWSGGYWTTPLRSQIDIWKIVET
jgi:WD40 repeat protein